MKSKTKKRGSGNFETDYAKMMKKVSREVFGFSASKLHRSIKTYSRNRFKKETNKLLGN